jgi:hypothetical protein
VKSEVKEMRKIVMLALGVILVAATVSGVYATTNETVTPLNTNCNVSIESKTETLKEYVADGKITQEKADDILKQLENCDGTGNAKIGQTNGVSFGGGKGHGQGNGLRNMNGGNCTVE